jgi:peroxiredoxin
MQSVASLTLILAILVPQATGERPSPIGQQIKPFELQDYLGAKHKLADWAGNKAVVVVFLGTECPLAKLYGPRLAQLAAEYEPRGVAFVGIDSNQQDSLAEIAHYARTHKLEFPILKDPGNAVADQFGALRTPEAFLLDPQWTVRYWGRVDDQYGVGYSRPAARRNDLAIALDEFLAGNPIATPTTETAGCIIGRLRSVPPTGDITYSMHVAPILNQHCVSCHRPGQIAPFALTSYDEVVGWAETIREVIEDRRMPPWHANPEFGRFYNDARLPDADKELVLKWVSNGAPQGDPADLPKPPEFVEGWRIPEPDIVFRMTQPYTVPAKGVVPYQYFEVETGFTEDKWLAAAEARPGNRAVTHHLILFYHPPGKEQIGPEEPLFNSIAAFAPGLPPAVYPEGFSRRIPAGSKLIFQVHYTPNGTEQTDASEIGLIFADPKTVKREVSVAAALNWQFLIPPGEANHRVEATYRFDQAMMLYSLTPHMHLRGKSFHFEAAYPDGRKEVLLDVPRYDFNWQNFYVLAEPKLMPEGTQVNCTAVFDNSEENLANPNPSALVHWGDQTWDEMMVGTLAVSPVEQDLTLGPPQITRLSDAEYEVRFKYRPDRPAEAIYLAGSFNEWKSTAHRLEGPDADGLYATRLVLKPGSYEYKFVLDGTGWRYDPCNPIQAGLYRNSVLTVPAPRIAGSK